ncbi:hypothetical protein [Polyangium sp. 15x6]|uniref:hypothetical protein n=1 Tax=Polyangium sp. 15x6 TaxID=3042687 RepID=UPI00249B5A55|nr:hypothetical protein [Polyangium sp. 15x6]MDI3288576.1 hypothetical protein [Polyangium sp. 15x6]
MRLSSLTMLLCGVLVPLPALAQGDPKPADEDVPVVQMQNTSAGGGSAQAAPAKPAPAQSAQKPTAPDVQTPQGPPPSFGNSSPAVTGISGGNNAGKSDGFEFHGYFRAPMRIGIGARDNPLPDQSKTTLHAPVVPDDQYLNWQYSGHQARDWAELYFSYSKGWAKATAGILAFNFTDAAWKENLAQFGIAQGWVTLTPELPWLNVRLEAKVGSFWGRYGMAGRYDAGYYDTFLFGRTHTLGETLRMEIDVGDFTLWGEQGFGVRRPNPSIYNDARFTLVNHLHAGLNWKKMLDVSAHHFYTWAQEEDRPGSTLVNVPNGNMSVIGADVRLDANMYGYLYAGFSRVSAENARVVGPAVEVIHANGGGEFALGITSNYLDDATPQSEGNGAVNTLLAQYELSIANILSNMKTPGQRYWGEGPDLKIAAFTMANFISSKDPDMDGVRKLKYGFDLNGRIKSWLGLGLRFDRLQPNSKIPEQSFAILSPRIVFRSDWLAHEEISLQYSRYFYNVRECAAASPLQCTQPPAAPTLPDGFGATTTNQDPGTRGAPATRPDLNVIRLQASIWW